jgi:Homeodomain-like domain/DDE superfamily endonuclease
MRKPVAALEISAGQRELLESVARSQSGAHREVMRAKALLMASQGVANSAIAQALSVSPASVANWRARFAEEGMARLGQVRAGRGRKPSIPQETIEEILDLTQNYRPLGQTHWSCRTMAEAVGVSKDTVQRAWLDKHPRFHLHFTPTSSSWLNLVERWFRELTDKALRRGVFHSVPDLIAAIEEYLDAHNEDPRPYVWTATAESILAKVARGRIALEKVS